MDKNNRHRSSRCFAMILLQVLAAPAMTKEKAK
jgi:hypothetical protein